MNPHPLDSAPLNVSFCSLPPFLAAAAAAAFLFRDNQQGGRGVAATASQERPLHQQQQEQEQEQERYRAALRQIKHVGASFVKAEINRLEQVSCSADDVVRVICT